MSGASYLGLVPGDAEAGSVATVSDESGRTHRLPTAVAVKLAAGDPARSLVVPDAYVLALEVLGSAGGGADRAGCDALLTLAHEGRLICLDRATRLMDSAGAPLTTAV